MKDAARRKIEELVERFNCNIDVYKSGSYNEAQTRREFIEPFFEALGWDVYNRAGYAEQYKDVVHEDSVKVGVSLKAPDYSFRIGGQRKFFLEAKKPYVSIKDDIDPSYQLRRYAWSAKLPLSILTDFEELAVYDCRIKPSPRDKVGTGRITYYTYNRYVDEFDALYNVFSRDAVLKGSFDRYVVTTTGKRGTAEVDREFLKEIEGWRDSLARNIAIRNPKLTVDEMNFAVQQTIDRLIFLRICEDRGIEQYGSLQALLNGVNTYRRLFELFYQADTKYNSGLFDFSADKLTPDIKIDDDVLKGIIDSLYYPKSPYEFSVLGVDILGNVYEQFLGKVIRLTAGHNAKVEEKPEVKKAGGVYYTPEYIVEYIVQNTVGKLVEGKTPKKAEELKILDPACGSGSFLIGAYQYLLNYHLKWYIENSPEKYAKGKFPAVYRSGEGWRLTSQEKKRILLNNIFGVDIDRQAVEVTKLSLLLKVLEDENRETIGKNLLLFRERVLPNLDDNIKCGNSLIGTDFYSSTLPLLPSHQGRGKFPSPLAGEGWGEGDDLNRKLNPFDWHDPEKGFGKVMKDGGFDCIIGNPPWVSLSGKFGNDILSEDAQQYLINKYQGNTYMPNLYEYFVHRGLMLTKKEGYFSFIVPDRLGYNATFTNLRKKILKNYKIEELIYKADFPNIVTDTLIFRIFNPNKYRVSYQIKVGEFGKELQIRTSDEYLKDSEYKFTYETSNLVGKVLNKLFSSKQFKPLGLIVETTSGFGGKSEEITERQGNKRQIEIVRGRSVQKYSIVEIFYFEFKRENITGRTTDPAKLGAKEKVLLRKTGYPIFATYDNSGRYPEQSLYFLFNNKTNLSLKYLAAIINSNLFQFTYWNRLVTNRNSTPQLKKSDLDRFPVYIINFNNKKEKAMHDQIVSLVDKMLDLHEKLKKAKTPHDRELIERQIKATDSQIDRLVYELYGLTEEEIRVVEGTNA